MGELTFQRDWEREAHTEPERFARIRHVWSLAVVSHH